MVGENNNETVSGSFTPSRVQGAWPNVGASKTKIS